MIPPVPLLVYQLHREVLRVHSLRHPRDFFDMFDSWDDRLAAFAARPGHPMRDLAALFAD